jgi:ribosomal protein S14
VTLDEIKAAIARAKEPRAVTLYDAAKVLASRSQCEGCGGSHDGGWFVASYMRMIRLCRECLRNEHNRLDAPRWPRVARRWEAKHR